MIDLSREQLADSNVRIIFFLRRRERWQVQGHVLQHQRHQSGDEEEEGAPQRRRRQEEQGHAGQLLKGKSRR